MAIAADSIVAGAFFKTPNNRIRAVLEVKDGKVKYAAGASDFQNRNFGRHQWQALDRFLADVDEEVEETWDPNYRHPEQTRGGAPLDSES